MKASSFILRLSLLASVAALSGCATLQNNRAKEDAEWAATAPMEPVTTPASNGSIYQADQNMELFNDAKAHRVGDILTVNLVEATQASKKSATATSKTDKTSIDAPTVLGHTLKVGGVAANIGTDGDRSFDGSGSSSQSNQLSGQLTVTVAQRLGNGNLLVRGQKWLTINQGQELVRISGIVRAQDIAQDNSVLSTRVADARITYAGKGALADANTQGWLSRFFSSKWMPF